jgi:hypothetical protein
VQRSVITWENSRNQKGELTHSQVAQDYTYKVDESCWNPKSERWDCPFPGCSRCFNSKNAVRIELRNHLESGVHETARYHCSQVGCGRIFVSLASLEQHLAATGHARRAERAVHYLIEDAKRQRQMLMITDGEDPPPRWEGILFFDGAAQPNPGYGGCGWLLLDDRGKFW